MNPCVGFPCRYRCANSLVFRPLRLTHSNGVHDAGFSAIIAHHTPGVQLTSPIDRCPISGRHVAKQQLTISSRTYAFIFTCIPRVGLTQHTRAPASPKSHTSERRCVFCIMHDASSRLAKRNTRDAPFAFLRAVSRCMLLEHIER